MWHVPMEKPGWEQGLAVLCGWGRFSFVKGLTRYALLSSIVFFSSLIGISIFSSARHLLCYARKKTVHFLWRCHQRKCPCVALGRGFLELQAAMRTTCPQHSRLLVGSRSFP